MVVVTLAVAFLWVVVVVTLALAFLWVVVVVTLAVAFLWVVVVGSVVASGLGFTFGCVVMGLYFGVWDVPLPVVTGLTEIFLYFLSFVCVVFDSFAVTTVTAGCLVVTPVTSSLFVTFVTSGFSARGVADFVVPASFVVLATGSFVDRVFFNTVDHHVDFGVCCRPAVVV